MTVTAERRGLLLLTRGEACTFEGPGWMETRGMPGELLSFLTSDFTFALLYLFGSVTGACFER